jgi:Carbohydrate phosphorylase
VHAVLLQDFVKIFPEKFQNKTNGVTPRRWLAFCNPELSALITETLGSDAWMKELDLLQVRWLNVLAKVPGFCTSAVVHLLYLYGILTAVPDHAAYVAILCGRA